MKKNMNIILVSQFYSTRMAKPNDHENFFLFCDFIIIFY